MSALRAALPGRPPIAGLADGSVLVSTQDTVWRVDAQGRLVRIAGTGESGYTGDGGPATKAEVSVDAVAALPGGGFLLADVDDQRIRMVDAAGTITTVAGGGTSRADGVPATQAALRQPTALSALPGGGLLIVDAGTRLLEVGPDGLIRTLLDAGARRLYIGAVAPAPDGSILLTAGDAIDRLTPDGRITTLRRGLAPTFITALSDGGYAFVDDRVNARTLDERVRIVRVAPDGRMTALVGGGPFATVAPRGLDARLDGRPATAFATSPPGGIAAAADGGLLFTYDIDNGGNENPGGAIGYVAPAAPAILGAALRRDGARVFAPGRAGAVHVVLSLPATVTLRVAGRSVTRALPAGVSRVPLPRVPARAQTVALAAADAAGRRAFDRTQVFPRGWLPTETARLVAQSLTRASEGEGCRRYGAARVDCQVAGDQSCHMVSVRYAGERLRWRAYSGCAAHARPRFLGPLRRLRARDWLCAPHDPCRPALFGRVGEAHLIPAD
jgi:hypothetical protein